MDQRSTQGLRAYLIGDVSLKRADIPMLVCSLLSGLVDGVAFNAGSVFVSMQTGNTIFVALGAAGLPVGDTQLWLRALISVAAFLVGCSIFSSVSRLLGHRSRINLCSSFLLQTVLVIISAALAQTNIAPAFALTQVNPGTEIIDYSTKKHSNEEHFAVYIVIALLAIQASGQITLSRSLGFNEIPSVVMTSLYCDLLSDPRLFALPLASNPKRNRRVASVVLFLIGGIISGWLQRTRAGMPGVLWIVASMKLIMTISWLLWRPQNAIEKNGS
ncbi:unnamed protein product [Clonostachys rosea]|uniref:DUF1275 domain protein n=1 Tax=Bionectria ochroleuca TaxID=29856 RepID=A0ABY6UM90_BIOOC|nr:unnamed protein product [Clonostachys rosea]